MMKMLAKCGMAAALVLSASLAAAADDAYVICDTASFNGAWDITSGWQSDDRAAPQRDENQTHSVINDVDTRRASSLFRDFGRMSGGTLTFAGSVTFMKGFDGMTFTFTDGDETTYCLETADGAFGVRQTDGTLRTAYTPDDGKTSFDIRITLDLDAGTATTFIDGKNCGSDDLLAPSVSRFGYTTTKCGTVTVKPNHTQLFANYALYETFDDYTDACVPFGFVSSGVNDAGAKDGELYCGNGGIVRADFDIACKNALEVYVCAPSDAYGTMSVLADHGAAYAFSVAGGYFRLGSEAIYKYVPDMWYRLRFETDFDNGTVLVKLNGRKIGTYALGEGVTKLTRVSFNFTGSKIRFDNLKVFPLEEHADYVPAPIVPTDSENYLVGVNVCPLWNNDEHYGWGLVTPFERPVLGWYDEGNPETADWEIKYMVEHGIDFEAVCWYPDKTDEPLKSPELSSHLHDGFMNAKYADKMKYCLIWECRNGGVPTTMEDAKAFFVPYIIENYFKDDRYLVIDNKPVLGFFAVGSLMNALTFGDKTSAEAGSWRDLKPLLDYIESEARKLGFDGVTFISSDASNKYLGYMGVDASFAYGFGKEGYSLDYNKQKNLENASDGSVYTIPTVSVGFNNIAWNGTRSPLMSVSDFAAAQDWVKNTYLKQYPNPLGVKTVMLSNWNEFGEGTYIFPSENNGGFGYLDALREAYTDGGADASLNTVPTEAQLARITRKYPQNVVRIRNNGETITDTETYSLYLDGKKFTPSVNAESKDGTVYYPFDAESRLHELLGIAYTFDGETLTLLGDDTVSFTVGKDAYIRNGIPMIPLEEALGVLGIGFAREGNTFTVQTVFANRVPLSLRVVSAEASGSSLHVTGYSTVALGMGRCAVFAAYDADRRLIGTKIVTPGEHRTFDATIAGAADAALVKLFAFDTLDSITPCAEAAKALGSEDNIIDIGGFWD